MKVNKSRQEELIVKQWFKIMVICISVFTFLISIGTIYRSFHINRGIDEIKYIYDISNNSKYKVYLYPNSFFEEEYLDMGKQYTAKLIDRINIDFFSDLSISKLSNIEYDYTVIATINGKYQNDINSLDATLWTKSYTLVDNVQNNLMDVSSSEVKVPVEINYGFFQNLVTEFQKQLRLDIDATLDVDFIINYKFYVAGDKVIRNEVVKLQIPLSDPTFSINLNVPADVNEVVYYELEVDYNLVQLIGGCILLVGSILGCVSFVMMLISDTKKTLYVIKLNKILKDYGEIIAETLNLPDLTNQDVLDIKEFSDLVDIEEELKIPIIYYEVKKNKEGWFLLTHNQHTYRFILKEKNGRKK